ncbi:hypothetical protein Tco_0985775 [Tanacetum coccineum]
MHVFNFTSVESSSSVKRPKSKDTKSKNRVLKNTNDRSSSAHDRKMSSSDITDSNKRETINSTVCQSNASVLNTKTVNAVNDGSNIVFVSCGKDVFMRSHEKCVARYALSRDSRGTQSLIHYPQISLRSSWEQSALGMLISKQSLDMEIMFKAISRYVMYTTLRA